MLLIQNGHVIDPASGRSEKLDILIKEQKLYKIGQNLQETMSADELASYTVIDAAGLIVAPGLVDVHVHFRDPGFTYKEDIYTGAAAAARGGFTTVVLMANTKPPVDNRDTLNYILAEGAKTDIRVETCCTVTMGMQGKELVPMKELKAAGAAGFTDDGIPLTDETLVREAMICAKEVDMPLSFHEEDPSLIENNGVNRGKASEYYHIGGSPREAEISLVERDLKIALETGACINIQHISTREAVELVRKAKKKGGDIHAEATPHHFTLTEEDVITYGTLAKMNPPLREEEDRLAIIRGLQDGTIDIIATDHAPHSVQEKEKPLTEAPSGIIGLETALALGITELVDKGYLTLEQLIEKMSCNPAAMYHLNAGYLAEDGAADLVLFDPEMIWRPEAYASKSSNSPFTGRSMKGRVEYVICRGKVVAGHRIRQQ